MADDLLISGGGSTTVAVDELYASGQCLRRLAAEASSLRMRLASIDRLVSLRSLEAAAVPTGAALAEHDIDGARSALAQLEAQARAIEWAIGTAADGYTFVERFITRLGSELVSGAAGLLGRILPSLGLSVLPVAAAAMGGVALGLAPHPGALSRLARENNELVTNPVTSTAVRQVVMSSDELILGAAGVPPALATALGQAGFTGTAFSAATLLGLGQGRLLGETPVRLASTSTVVVPAAPVGFAERLGRVPDPETAGGAQVVIERYSTPGEPDRFGVYVAGTVSFSPFADGEPWDMTSNIANAAGDGSASVAAVAEAMRLAGIGPHDPVQLTGYSQGGAVAARVAASGHFAVQGLATFGAPVGQIAVPETIPTVIVEHSDDIVPALGGDQANEQAVFVRRDVFGGRDIPSQYAVPAHHYEYYAETAALMDAAASDRLKDTVARLDSFGAGATTVTSTAYSFERVPQAAARPVPVSGPSDGR
jgi:predicted alpha/beta-hydrolase family hydrolase